MLWKTMKWLKSTHHLVLLLKQYFGRIAAKDCRRLGEPSIYCGIP